MSRQNRQRKCACKCGLLSPRGQKFYNREHYAQSRRGSNPLTHIRVRINGVRHYLHRVLAAEMEGRVLRPYPEEIVHHRDNKKHHNCIPGKIQCGDPLCFGNLEVLREDAAVEHINYHQIQLQRARRMKKHGGRRLRAA